MKPAHTHRKASAACGRAAMGYLAVRLHGIGGFAIRPVNPALATH